MPFCLYGDRSLIGSSCALCDPAVGLLEAAIMRIDLNADVGESFGAYTIGDDAE